MTGAAITPLANPLTFIAAGAAVAFWFFFATEKELSPRGYERNEIIGAWWVPPSIFLCLVILDTKIKNQPFYSPAPMESFGPAVENGA